MTTEPHIPPMEASNEAEPEQLDIARAQGGTYGQALQAMDEESGAVTQRAGDYLVAFVQENADGMYEFQDGQLVWCEAPADQRSPSASLSSRSACSAGDGGSSGWAASSRSKSPSRTSP